jgi:hypothetical protein
MSIIALAIRMSATRALETEGATLAGARVFDSAITPLDEMVSAEPKPMIVVSTEDDSAEVGGADWNSGGRSIQLVIETAMSQSVELPDGEGQGVLVPNTDAGLELTLAVLSRQISACLFGRGGGAWGVVFRKFVTGASEVVSRRGIQSKEGARIAARQTVYSISAMAEPPFDQPVAADTPLGAFLAAAAADPQTASLAALIREVIEGEPVGWPETYSVAAMIAGLSDELGQAIGISALGGGADNTPIVEATFAADDRAAFTADAAEILAQLPEAP